MKQDDMLNGFVAVGDEPVWETAKERRARLRPAAKTLAKENKWTMDQAWAFLDRGLGQVPTREAPPASAGTTSNAPPSYSTPLADLNQVAQKMAERATKAIFMDESGLWESDGKSDPKVISATPRFAGQVGDTFVDNSTGARWICTVAGNPGKWVKVGNEEISTEIPGLTFRPTSVTYAPMPSQNFILDNVGWMGPGWGSAPPVKPAPAPPKTPEPALSKNGRCIRLNSDAN